MLHINPFSVAGLASPPMRARPSFISVQLEVSSSIPTWTSFFTTFLLEVVSTKPTWSKVFLNIICLKNRRKPLRRVIETGSDSV